MIILYVLTSQDTNRLSCNHVHGETVTTVQRRGFWFKKRNNQAGHDLSREV